MAIEAEKKVLLLESKIEEDKPKVELANDLLDSTGLTPIKLAAKELGIPPMTFFKMLRVDGIIDSHNIMYQRFINSGLGEIKVTTRNNKMFSSTLFTPKGLASLHKKYKDYTNT
jgi:phage antirepressor YoqD-like protein